MANNTLDIYTDGGSRGNPGKAAAAFVVYKNTELVFESSFYLGVNTNNFAEYSALLKALQWLVDSADKNISVVNIYIDSELVVRQLTGKYKIKSKNLIPLILEIKTIEKNVPVKIFYHHVLRNENKEADMLVNKRLDES